MPAAEVLNRVGALLEQRRDELETQIRRKLAEAREVAGSTAVDQIIEGGDYAAADLIAAVDIAEAQRDIVELREVNAASRRLAEGEYGTCADCGGDIAPARLQAYPTAVRCTACQASAEHRAGSLHTRL